MSLLSGKVAIITGASKGIGRVMSQRFAQEGARVVCAARSAALVEETAELIRKANGETVTVVGDAATEEGARRIVTAGVKAFGKVDTLVNNAGDGGPTKPVQEYATEDWFYTINSCLTSAYMMTRFAVPEIIKAGGGSIVNISSVAGRRGLAYRIGYCSAKAGQVGMTYGLAMRRIVLPQAARVIVPPLGNEFNAMLKNTSLVFSIGVYEMFSDAEIRYSTSFKPVEYFGAVAFWYLVLTGVWSLIQAQIERKLAVSERGDEVPFWERMMEAWAPVQAWARGAR